MSTIVGVYRQGGRGVLANGLKYSSVDWEKSLNEPGEASVTIPAACVPDALFGAHPYVHELRIEVDGEVAFVGPIRYVALPTEDNVGQMSIFASDMLHWFEVRFARFNQDFTGAGNTVTEIMEQVIRNALAINDPNLLPFLDINDCPTGHEREVQEFDNAWESHISTVAGSLMNIRTHGRTISIWCADECLGELPRVRTDQFSNWLNVARDGDEFATDVAIYGKTVEETVAGAPTKTTQIIGTNTPGGSPELGGVLVERTFSEDSYLDVASATAAAARLTRARAPLGFAESDTFRAETTCESPWPITRVAPGMCTIVGTRFGDLSLQVSSVSGRVTSQGVESFFVGFEEIERET